MNPAALRLAAALEALGSIQERLSASLREDSAMFPVTAASARSRDIAEMKTRDAFLQRFQQTSDHLLRKLFPRLQAAIVGSPDPLTIGELLQDLHRAGVIDDPETWRQILELRNRLTHDYALDAEDLAASLNEAWRRAPELVRQYHLALAFAQDHALVDRVTP